MAEKLSFLKNSSDLVLTNSDFITHGPPGVGKTFFAATGSKFFPRTEEEINDGKKRHLSDILFLTADAGAVDGLSEMKLSVDVLSIKEAIEILDVPKGITAILEEAKKICEAGKYSWVVTDTVSVLDKYITEYYDRFSPKTQKGDTDTLGMYRLIFNQHKRFHAALSKLPARKHYLFHSKFQGGQLQKNEDAIAKKKASTTTADTETFPEVTGQAKSLYVANASIEFVLQASVVPGKGKRKLTRWVKPFGGDGFEGKNRFERSLEEKEEPDLYKIIEKIKANI